MKFKFDQIAINSTAKKKPEPEDAANYIGLEHLTPGTFEISEWGSSVAPVGEKLLMKKGDVLFGRRRAYQRKVGIAPFDGIFSAHGMVLRPRTEVVDESYFPFFISSDQFMNEAVRISVGSLSPTINWGTLKNCEFDLPPMEEQKKLAELLWAANDLKEKYKKAITATDEMLKAKFREMFGEVGNEDGPRGDAEARREGESGLAAKNAKVAKSKWPMVRLVDLAKEISAGKDVPREYKKTRDEDYQIPIYSNSVDNKGLYGFAKEARIFEPSLTITARGTIGYVCARYKPFVPIIRLIVFTPKVDVLDLRYAEYSLQGKCAANGVTSIPQLTVPAFKEYKIPLPPLSLQREFVAIAEKAEAAKTALKKSIADIDQVMKGLINQ